MRMPLICLAALLLQACGDNGGARDGAVKSDIDKQAIEQGLLPDPKSRILAGRFETRSDLGVDKFCAVEEGGNRYRIGMLAVFGPESKCEAQGTARFDGENVSIQLKGKETCNFDAEYDGIELRFPGSIPKGCASYCSARASMSGTSYYFVERGNDNAKRAIGRDFEKLCP